MNLGNIDFLITLRCNSFCLSCIEFCNMKELTGLNYADSDVPMENVEKLSIRYRKYWT